MYHCEYGLEPKDEQPPIYVGCDTEKEEDPDSSMEAQPGLEEQNVVEFEGEGTSSADEVSVVVISSESSITSPMNSSPELLIDEDEQKPTPLHLQKASQRWKGQVTSHFTVLHLFSIMTYRSFFKVHNFVIITSLSLML